MKRLLLLFLLGIAIWKLPQLFEGEVVYAPGIRIAEQPYQQKLIDASSLNLDGYRITPLAEFSLKAKVLGKKSYFWGREADISPLDLVLGWEGMSDQAVVDRISIRQSNRWYFWQANEMPLPKREIERSSANMHMIPASPLIEDLLEDIRKGEFIFLSGQLVRVDAGDGWNWQSSLSRDDVGARACEVVWVEDIRVIEHPSR